MITWRVLRRGRPSAGVRTLYDGPKAERAIRVYEREKARMRQGTLALTKDGVVMRQKSEPMVRTRW